MFQFISIKPSNLMPMFITLKKSVTLQGKGSNCPSPILMSIYYIILQTKISDMYFFIRTHTHFQGIEHSLEKNRCFSFEANVAGIVRDRKKFQNENRIALKVLQNYSKKIFFLLIKQKHRIIIAERYRDDQHMLCVVL